MIRSFALLACVLAVLPRHACERRNPEFCEAQSECAEGMVCQSGKCQAPECSATLACPLSRPVCQAGLCQPCETNKQCEGRSLTTGRPAPVCIKALGCVECNPQGGMGAASGCGDPLRPVCEPTDGICRQCSQHKECATGLCAKDDLLASLPAGKAIPKGVCVPPLRTLPVDGRDPQCKANVAPFCTLRQALDEVSEDRPFVIVRDSGHVFSNITIPGKNTALKAVHIIGPDADTPITARTTYPIIGDERMGSNVVTIASGYKAVLEGMAIQRGFYGIDCRGAAVDSTVTEVRLLRSLVSGTETAVRANFCTVQMDQTWIGRGPAPLFSSFVHNGHALDFSSSDFSIVNSVIWRNGFDGTFGGIQISDVLGRPAQVSRIVNSTIGGHENRSIRGAASLECDVDLKGRLLLVNTYFWNATLGDTGKATRHIAEMCNPEVRGGASNDQILPGLVVSSGMDFTDVETGNLRLIKGAQATSVGVDSVKARELLSSGPGAEVEVVPRIDMDGRKRGLLTQGKVSAGAFEAP